MVKDYTETDAIVTKVAWHYYKEGLTQTEIAELLGINRNKVVRLLDKARVDGIVQFHIKGIEANCLEIKNSLIERFNLENAVVVLNPSKKENLRSVLAKAAAQMLHEKLSDHDLIGIGWGEAVSNTLRNLHLEQDMNLSLVTLTGGVNKYIQRANLPNEGRFNGSIYAIPSPFITSTEEVAQQFLREPSVNEIVETALLCKYAVIGIGGLSKESTIIQEKTLSINELTDITNKGGIGDILGSFYDIDGNIIDIPLHRRLVGISPEKLRSINVIAVAGGEEKVNAIFGALKGGYISTLVTDENTAAKLLELEKG